MPQNTKNKFFSEISWQTVKQIAEKLLVHARLPPIFFHHALLYEVEILNVIPVKKLEKKMVLQLHLMNYL